MHSWNSSNIPKMKNFNPNPHNNPNNSCNDPQELRPIEEIPHPYQDIFAEYPCFNAIQSKILDDILYTDTSLVVSAPTGSGKTTIFELAIVRLLIACEKNKNISNLFKIVYVSPMKALCEERLVDWHRKFAKFGLNCILVTGDSEIASFEQLLTHNLIITTPEKWDSLTRRWKDNTKLVQLIKLFMIDEVHLLNEEQRGSTLEMIICRMKTIEESTRASLQMGHKIRFVAVSATLANIEDIAEWIGKFSSVKHFKFSNNLRPVKLNKIVIGYPHNVQSTPFKFDFFLNFKLQALIMKYSNGKPTLIFSTTRKMVEVTAKHLLQNLTLKFTPEQKTELVSIASQIIGDENARTAITHGIGYHHAGLLPQNRKLIENAFRDGKLPILVTTSTLSVGINLPAHLVIVKSTKFYSNGGYQDYSETMLMQMIGRAGRPQFDTSATALILTSLKDKEKFERMVGGAQVVESNLHRHLVEHLNAEVVLRTITDLDVAMKWISTTFLHVRAKKNPRHYGIASSSVKEIDQKLLELCQAAVNKLVSAGMVTIDVDAVLQPTPDGVLMAKYYLAFETMKLFTEMNGKEILQQMLAVISKCAEFSQTFLRVNDKKCLNLLNKCRDKETIRFPLNGKISSLDMKINCVIQAVLGCLDICDHSIYSETFKIMRNGERIAKCLIEYLESKSDCFKALLNTIILSKCLHVKLWENSPYVSKQLTGIGTVLSSHFVNAGKTTFQAIADSSPREIELIINKKPPMGDKILEQIRLLPRYSLSLELNGSFLSLRVNLENYLDLQGDMSGNPNALMHLLIGDSGNKIHFYAKYSHSFMIENPEIVQKVVVDSVKGLESIEAHFISEDFVGIDCKAVLEFNSEKKEEPELQLSKKSTKPTKKESELNYMQNFMDMYLKIKEKRCKKTKTVKKNEQNIIIHSDVVIRERIPENIAESSEIIESEPVVIEKKGSTDRESSKYAIDDEDVDDFLNSEFEAEKAEIQPQEKVTTLSKFRFTPRKFAHPPPEEKPYEIVEILEPKKSVQKISWRSPVIIDSPAVKFSPVLEKRFQRNENHQINQSFEIRNAIASPSTSTQPFFPLSDKDCKVSNNNIEEEAMSSIESKISCLSDVVSPDTFEQVGLYKHYQNSVNKRNFNKTDPNQSCYFSSERKKFKCNSPELASTPQSLISVARSDFLLPQRPVQFSRRMTQTPVAARKRSDSPASSAYSSFYCNGTVENSNFMQREVVNSSQRSGYHQFSAPSAPNLLPPSDSYLNRSFIDDSSSGFIECESGNSAGQAGSYRNYNRKPPPADIFYNNSGSEDGFESISQINEKQFASPAISSHFSNNNYIEEEEVNSESLSPICGSQQERVVNDFGYEYLRSTMTQHEEDSFGLNYERTRLDNQFYRRGEVFNEVVARGRHCDYFSQQNPSFYRDREVASLPRFHVGRNYQPEPPELKQYFNSYIMEKFLQDIDKKNSKYFR